MGSTEKCPPLKHLAKFAKGTLSKEAQEILLLHANTCKHCNQTIRSLREVESEAATAKRAQPTLVPATNQAGSSTNFIRSIGLVLLLAFLGAGGYLGWSQWSKEPVPESVKSQAVAVDNENTPSVAASEQPVYRAEIQESPKHGRVEKHALPKQTDSKQETAQNLVQKSQRLRDDGDLIEAIKTLRQAVQQDRDYGIAHVELADALREAGKLREAIHALQEAERVMPNNVQVWQNLIYYYTDLGDKAGKEAAELKYNTLTKSSASVKPPVNNEVTLTIANRSGQDVGIYYWEKQKDLDVEFYPLVKAGATKKGVVTYQGARWKAKIGNSKVAEIWVPEQQSATWEIRPPLRFLKWLGEGGQRFERVNGVDWHQFDRNGKLIGKFVENARTDQWVGIYDSQSEVWVRLLKNDAVFSGPNTNGWQTLAIRAKRSP